jgi:arylsulfatase A-like enzyme
MDICPRIGDTPAPDIPSRTAIYAEAVDKRCVRTREWKYIHYPGKPYGELYHLTQDPYELDNLYDRETDVRKAMRELYYDVLDRTEDFRHPTYARFTGIHPETGQESTHYHTW